MTTLMVLFLAVATVTEATVLNMVVFVYAMVLGNLTLKANTGKN